MKKVLFLTVFMLVISLQAQQNKTIKSGEKLTYTASYAMSGLLTSLAQVTMEAKEVKTSKSTLLHLKCKASTYSKWDNFFKIRDIYESYVSPKSLKPRLYKRSIDEGGYIKNVKYAFNYGKRLVKSTISRKDGREYKKSLPLSYNANDVISTLYQVRNMDIAKAKPGDAQTLKVLFDEKEKAIRVTYVKKETITVKQLGKVMCYKIVVSSSEAALKGKGQNTIWLTADAKKIPVLLKFSIPVGNGQLTLDSAQGI